MSEIVKKDFKGNLKCLLADIYQYLAYQYIWDTKKFIKDIRSRDLMNEIEEVMEELHK